ncbi:uncharacterized protein LOC143197117 [Rhynchophorus ferrugineus]|uniref:uncharacterized protein LOC143197117 n=1 Tax=Rhynchophorus ferrugineus TaxID=354439 RepID=UPI003FCDBAB2
MVSNMETVLLLTIYFVGTSAAPPLLRSLSEEDSVRVGKNIGFFDYIQPAIDYDNYESDTDEYVEAENELSRTIPSKKNRRPQYNNSPIYYIRLPPQPYMFVPGLGYVSQPPQNPISPFVNVPVNFVSNGKPNGIYQWSGGVEMTTAAPPRTTTTKPKPAKKPVKTTLSDSTIHRLPGQFVFNGKPEDIFVLRDSYNSLYGDVLQNLYP